MIGAGRATARCIAFTAAMLARAFLPLAVLAVSTMGKRTSAHTLLRKSIEIRRQAPLRLHSKSLRPRFTKARFQTDASSVRRILGNILAGEHQDTFGALRRAFKANDADPNRRRNGRNPVSRAPTWWGS